MGRSKSLLEPLGARRVSQGISLAPKSLRRKGRVYLSDCSIEELLKAGVARNRRKDDIDIEKDRRK